jgi:uncharacterized protein (DUF2147 family)
MNMKNGLKMAFATAVLSAGMVGTSFAAEPINGTLIKYSGKGNTFCGRVLNGKYKGKSIGCMSGKKGRYRGKVNVLDEGKTYKGKASVSGNTLKLAGCVAGGLICKSANLKRQ